MVAISMGKEYAVDGTFPEAAHTKRDLLHRGIQPRIHAVEVFIRQNKDTVRFPGIDKDKRDLMRSGRCGKSVLRYALHRQRYSIRERILEAGGTQQCA